MLHASELHERVPSAVVAELRVLLSKITKPNEAIIPAEAIARAAMVSCRRVFPSVV